MKALSYKSLDTDSLLSARQVYQEIIRTNSYEVVMKRIATSDASSEYYDEKLTKTCELHKLNFCVHIDTPIDSNLNCISEDFVASDSLEANILSHSQKRIFLEITGQLNSIAKIIMPVFHRKNETDFDSCFDASSGFTRILLYVNPRFNKEPFHITIYSRSSLCFKPRFNNFMVFNESNAKRYFGILPARLAISICNELVKTTSKIHKGEVGFKEYIEFILDIKRQNQQLSGII